jgi:membrane-bound lytic murein transglycosylase B
VALLAKGRRGWAATVVAFCAGLLAATLVAVPNAHADSPGQASATVQRLLAKVHTLQAEAKIAERHYQEALSGVEDSVNQAITSDQDSSEIAFQASQAQSLLSQRVQGLYESGGNLETAASLLTSGTVTQVYDRNVLAARVVSEQMRGVRQAGVLAAAAAHAASTAEHQESHRIGTERAVAKAANRVESLLARQSALLHTANQHLAAIRRAQELLAEQARDFSTITAHSLAGLHVLPPSAEYLALYQQAALTCPGLPWTVLAAIGQVESGHGRNLSTSSAGAQGPMQFEPATFAAYAVDGDHDGVTSIMDPADAIFTAAHYLCANGAGASANGLSGAILHYNHAEWYVEMVLKLAGLYASTYS